GAAAAQPGGGDHRRAQRGADRGGQRVQPPDQHILALNLGVAERRALFLAPAPPAIPAIRQPTFTARPAPPGPAGRTCSPASSPRPPAGPGPSPAPGPPATRGSGRQTSRESSPDRATIALARCPLSWERGSFSNSHHPSSEGTFRANTPARTPI